MKKRALIICYSHHASEPRLLKVVNALSKGYSITTAGFSGLVNNPEVQFVRLTQQMKQPAKITFHHNKPILIRKLGSLAEKVYRKVFRTINGFFYSPSDYDLLKDHHFEVIFAHHPNSIELAVRLAKKNGAKLVLNCHEYYPLEFDNNPVWMQYEKPIVDLLLHKYKTEIDLWLTVSHHIQAEYERVFGANCFLLYNSKPYLKKDVRRNKTGPIKIIHHGGAMPERKLELMIKAFEPISGYCSLYLMLVPTNPEYLQKLRKETEHVPNLHFIDPVPTTRIVEEICQYDVGLFFIGDEIFNYKYCLPNKLFEFIQARLCVVVTPNPEMKALVEKYQIGYVAESYDLSDCAAVLKNLSREKVEQAQLNCERAAIDYDSLKNEQHLLDQVNKLCAA